MKNYQYKIKYENWNLKTFLIRSVFLSELWNTNKCRCSGDIYHLILYDLFFNIVFHLYFIFFSFFFLAVEGFFYYCVKYLVKLFYTYTKNTIKFLQSSTISRIKLLREYFLFLSHIYYSFPISLAIEIYYLYFTPPSSNNT